MNARQVVELPLDHIDDGSRLRAIDMLQAEALAESIKARGLLSPIEVAKLPEHDKYALITGAHRLQAMRILGRDTIPAFVREVRDDFEQQLVEIEENLIRHDLTALDRAVFLAKWKAIYDKMVDAPGKGRPSKPKNGQELPILPLRFSEAVRERLKMSRRSVDMAVKRASLSPDLRKALTGHPAADNAALLDKLAKLPAPEQGEVARLLTREPEQSITDIKKFCAQLIGEDEAPARDKFEVFLLLWAKMTPDEKSRVDRFVLAETWVGKKKGRTP